MVATPLEIPRGKGRLKEIPDVDCVPWSRSFIRYKVEGDESLTQGRGELTPASVPTIQSGLEKYSTPTLGRLIGSEHHYRGVMV